MPLPDLANDLPLGGSVVVPMRLAYEFGIFGGLEVGSHRNKVPQRMIIMSLQAEISRYSHLDITQASRRCLRSKRDTSKELLPSPFVAKKEGPPAIPGIQYI